MLLTSNAAFAVSPTALNMGIGTNSSFVGDIYPTSSYVNNYLISTTTTYISATANSGTISSTAACFAASAGCDFRVKANGVGPVVSNTNVTDGSAWMLNPQKCLVSTGVSYFGLQSDTGNCAVTMSLYRK